MSRNSLRASGRLVSYIVGAKLVLTDGTPCDVCKGHTNGGMWIGTIKHGNKVVQERMVRCHNCYYLAPLPRPEHMQTQPTQLRLM